MTKNTKESWQGISHIRIRNDVLKSAPWRALSHGARSLYTDLRSWMYSGKNGDISATPKTLTELGYKKTTLAKYLRELRAAGFIAATRIGGVAQGSKVCNLYRFTDMPSAAIPKKNIEGKRATFDYMFKFQGLTTSNRDVETVRKMIAEEIAKAKSEAIKRQKPSRKKYYGSDSEPDRPRITTDYGLLDSHSGSKPELVAW